MRVLFVSSGNNNLGISSVVFNQGKTLIKENIKLEYFTIKGKGLFGYLKNIPNLRKFIKLNKFDIVHAHYSLSALTVTLSFPKIPIVTSLMGSDSKMNFFWRTLIKINYWFFWEAVIVKSKEMKNRLRLDKAFVIPNGVDLEKFCKPENEILPIELKDKNKRYILFLSNPSRIEKNYKLAENAFKMLNDDNVQLISVYNKPHNEIVHYLYNVDILLLTSLWEGSPNIIKEAMACNCPIVATDVGDVKWVMGDTDGCYITTFDPKDVTEKLKLALKFAKEKGRTNGRARIIKLGLDSDTIAKRIVDVYKNVLNTKNV